MIRFAACFQWCNGGNDRVSHACDLGTEEAEGGRGCILRKAIVLTPTSYSLTNPRIETSQHSASWDNVMLIKYRIHT